MSGDEYYEESDDPTCDTHGFDLSGSLSIRVEYYRSCEYSLTWTTSMSPRRSSRLKSSHKSPSSEEGGSQPRLRSRRGRSASKESDSHDVIDLIVSNFESDRADKDEAAGEAVGALGYGLDTSKDERSSECSSIASGPSSLSHHGGAELYCDLCSACQKLYSKAKRSATPIKSKLQDNDPESLTCDEWVLKKKWTPRRRPDARRKLLSPLHLDAGLGLLRGQHLSFCSRPHPFLQRNLRRAKRAAEQKTKRRRKRRRSSRGSRVAKQQRLQNDQHHAKTKGLVMNRAGRSRSSRGRAQRHVTVERVASPAAASAATSSEARAQERAPKKTSAFRDLLAQLRGNSSRIIRETR
ncbi:uncharacterized protein si:ch211-227n13.3 isoform X2 [Fundulus heteroclitus]|uniref:uncharacterized protein si:ch211-227n13.3 isoform X2 n=1 Tax=Fundulus heteroclitus TaxID=8078 RepID=UPI00165BD840|nr:uncharacterized protein si:ch211-227n13.3 isoform X2 [Fundulus heteroclitus]